MDKPDDNLEILSPDDSRARYKEAIDYLNSFYMNELRMEEYMPVVRDGLEEKLNLLQFIVNFNAANPFISSADRAILVMWITQAAFWMGYLEAKKPSIELSDSIMQGLKDL